ncbi:helix-turn-helix domain-containing protein [Micromonosporaceae bacterium Da 78-11]
MDSSTLHLRDPGAMRALAHPTRLRLLAELRRRGPQSVGTLSGILDEAVGSVSYHLGKLARHGFVVEAPECARSRRERWWRAAHEHTSTNPLEALENPERKAASDQLRRTVWQHYSALLEAYLEAEPSFAPEWVRGTTSSDVALRLTSAELVELRGELEALTARWAVRSAADRVGAEDIALIYHAIRRPA